MTFSSRAALLFLHFPVKLKLKVLVVKAFVKQTESNRVWGKKYGEDNFVHLKDAVTVNMTFKYWLESEI